eukprot:1455897-Rhodomonas_salina.1
MSTEPRSHTPGVNSTTTPVNSPTTAQSSILTHCSPTRTRNALTTLGGQLYSSHNTARTKGNAVRQYFLRTT